MTFKNGELLSDLTKEKNVGHFFGMGIPSSNIESKRGTNKEKPKIHFD